MKTNQMLYPFANVMGLFFPVGKLENGGTCEFATAKCLKKCCANAPGAGKKIGFKKKQECFNYFLNNSSIKIAAQILTELENADCEIFTWFASGDCPSFLILKFFAVIKELDKKGVIQTGFTRNQSLWEECRDLYNAKILLTIEDIERAQKPGLYSMPNYKIGAIDVLLVNFEKLYHGDGCGGGYYYNHILKTGIDNSHLKLDCKACYENKTGCFNTKPS